MGFIYESFIVLEIIKTLENQGINYKAFNWRSADKAEVDLVLESKGKTLPIEIKYKNEITGKDARGIKSFMEDNTDVEVGLLVYPGRKIRKISPQIYAVPDSYLLGIG